MKIAALLLTSLAYCLALTVPATSSAWQPVTEEEPAPLMKASNAELTLEVPLYMSGTIYLGDMDVECPDNELWFRYNDGSANTMYNGQIFLDTGYCSPERENSNALDACELSTVSLQSNMLAYGDESSDEIVINNGPSFAFQFEGLGCPVLDDTFSVGIPDEDSCRPDYDDALGEVDFNQLECLETQEGTSDFIRDGDPVEIEGVFTVFDPVSPFPYME